MDEMIAEGIKMRKLCGLKNISVDLIMVKHGAVEDCVIHNKTDEVLYILEGRLEAKLNNKIKIYEKGEAIIIPKKTKHILKNITEKEAKILSICSPSYDSKDCMVCPDGGA